MDMVEIARLEEGRQAQALSELADHALPIGGGIAGRGEPGSWLNAASGLGLNGPVNSADVDRLIEWYESAGIEPRVELCPFADESLIAALAARGFVVRLFESVLFRELDPRRPARPIFQPPADITIKRLDPANDDDVLEYSRVCSSGFLPPGMSEWPPEHLEVSMRVARHPRTIGVMAMNAGRCVGAGGMGLHDQVAALFGLSVLPEFRRRGIQQALIAERLNIAAERGARVATIGSRPGAGTERNVRRMGFQTAYIKPAVVRPGPGLTPYLS